MATTETMSDHMAAVKDHLVTFCKERIPAHWGDLRTWLDLDGDLVFGSAYVDRFKREFGVRITAKMEQDLYIGAHQLVYAIHAFMDLCLDSPRGASMRKVMNYTELFVRRQLDDFGNWFPDYTDLYDDVEDAAGGAAASHTEDNPQ